jgi:hypothetical protein
MSQTPSSAPNQQSAPSSPPASAPSQQPAPETPPATGRKLLLYISAALLLGWFAWLSYTALTKTHEPIVSRAQASAAKVVVVARVETEEQAREAKLARHGDEPFPVKSQAGKPQFFVKVIETLTANGPAKDSEIGVVNLPVCGGYTGPGEYLLLLDKDDATLDGHPAYFVVGPQRSPGADYDSGAPMIYKWGPGVRAQVQRLFP